MLTIAGSDSSGGAGIQADLKTFAAHGVDGASVVAAVTAQSTRAVHAVQAVAPRLVRAQLEAVLADGPVDGVKVGMLLTAGTVTLVAAALARRTVGPIVVDPVLRASAGRRLLDPAAVRLLRRRLVPLAAVVTPNLAEASALVDAPVRDVDEMRAAAEHIRAMGAHAVVVTGGHLAGDAVDVVAYDGTTRLLRGRRLPGPSPHGTGCTFAAALTVALVRGASILDAARHAKRYTVGCITRARRAGAGDDVLHHVPVRRR